MNSTLHDLLRSATQLTGSGRLREATAAIQRALGGGLPMARSATPAPTCTSPTVDVIDGCVHELPERSDPVPAAEPALRESPRSTPATPGRARVVDGAHTRAGLTRRYRLYLPHGATGQARPLVVMLHGCTQTPDDFATGTGMNALADTHGFCVLYPEQPQDANPSKCWNWFKHNHQSRERGETALIADMTQAVVREQGLDAGRVYIAGLSAGGAMAGLVAAAYPEIFAAVGVHSGLAPGVARSLPDALAAMRGAVGGTVLPAGLQGGLPQGLRAAAVAPVKIDLPVPTIIFHGDQDRTVHPVNGEQVLAAALRADGTGARACVEQGASTQGKRYTRSTYATDGGQLVAEHWLVHGAGHAWSGGDAAGSYTDAQGPDASREMWRFFESQAPRTAD